MIVALGVLIVGAVLIVSAAVVLLSLASETEVFPTLRQSGALGDEAPHVPRTQNNSSDSAHRARTRVPLSQWSGHRRPPDAGILPHRHGHYR